MERNFEYEYPYGKFPTKFTKNGQQKYFEELTSGHEKITTQEYSQPDSPQSHQAEHPTQSTFDISKLLPLLKLMNNKKNMSSSDILSLMLPLLGGGDSSQIADIM